MFQYTVKSGVKAFSDFTLNCPEALEKRSLVEVEGIRYQVYQKVCKIIQVPNSTETILILEKP